MVGHRVVRHVDRRDQPVLVENVHQLQRALVVEVVVGDVQRGDLVLGLVQICVEVGQIGHIQFKAGDAKGFNLVLVALGERMEKLTNVVVRDLRVRDVDLLELVLLELI